MINKRKEFTLIELIAVLVILAILALIVTPLVLNIIKKARTAADKRSIDAYGRSVEIAIAEYLLDNSKFSTSIEQLTIEYKGDEVVCSTTELKDDGSIYLANCTVGGRRVTGYTYGKSGEEGEEEPETPTTYEAYSVGDEITHNNVDYYVIEDSTAIESTVKLLKATPLTYEEVETYANVTGVASYDNGVGAMVYGTTSDYSTSYVKATVDAWKTVQAPAAIEARLLTKDELIDNLGYVLDTEAKQEAYKNTENTPSWVYNRNYNYWTMSPYQNSDSRLGWRVYVDGSLIISPMNDNVNAVRPVVILLKSGLKKTE